ncbi:MAG TPA: peptidoglycan DD-metalloendopeptidase family protein [Gammaproteobacteria bacterium]|nr:peptidoglycan DD-metalloendopeptidase family protein [Gammaproteobacteria bacterium]
MPVQFMLSLKKILSVKWLCVVILANTLLGCSGTSGKAPVVDRTHAGNQRQYNPVTSGQYIVKRGDTLYSIAFRFGWDWKALAARNAIRAPYVIVPGQVIRFSNTSKTPVVAKAPAAKPVKKPATVAQVKPVPAAKPVSPVTSTAKKSPPVAASSQGKWLWPAPGTLISVFSSNTSLNKGIDIAGKLGEPIVATADGSVVYAGSGLRGYGELVIIKHNDTFISAYGHNRRLLVNEGQTVKAGQHIAEMGSTGTDQVKVHFEIRRQGKPVDPLQYLPKR